MRTTKLSVFLYGCGRVFGAAYNIRTIERLAVATVIRVGKRTSVSYTHLTLPTIYSV